jgi:hypothetical protein
MQCQSPFLVKNTNLDVNNENLMTPVPCGKCIPCLKRRSSHWSFRINEEQKKAKSSCFLTLTYEKTPLSANGLPTLVKKDYQNFFKRLRKLAPAQKGKNRLKYFACGEYGTKTQRPHYHAIVFNIPQDIINNATQIRDTWKHGHVMVTNSNLATINYVVGYITKGGFKHQIDKEHGIYDDRIPDFQLMSKGLGECYLTPSMIKYYKDRKLFCIVHEDGHILSMPRYYKNKIFNKMELKELFKEWLEIQTMKTPDFLEMDGKTKKDIWIDMVDKREKQLNLKRAKL